MKKILHILAQKPDKTGSGIVLQNLLKEADKKGFEQAVIAGISVHDNDICISNVPENRFFPVIFETDELPFPVVGMSDIMPYESTKYSDLTDEMLVKWKATFEKKILEAVECFNPNIIISNHLWILTSFVTGLFKNIPVIAICHNTALRQHNLSPRFADYVINGCRKVKAVFTANNNQKKLIIEKYNIDNEKLIVTGSGYNSDIFYPADNQMNNIKTRLVFAGKLCFSKGVRALINVYTKICSTRNDIELILVGSGCGMETDEIVTKSKDCCSPVILKGLVHQKELGGIFRESDIFVLPSFYDGIPLVLVEALACGLRAVITDLPGLKGWLGEDLLNSSFIEFVKLISIPAFEYVK